MPVCQVFIITSRLEVVRLATRGLSSYLVVSEGESFLVEGAATAGEVRRICRSRACAPPSIILHSFLKDEFCVADQGLEAVPYVPSGLEYIASGGDAGLKPPNPTGVLADWGEKRGEEPFGIMGRVTVFPLRRKLKNFTTLKDGQNLRWRGCSIKALRTPSHGKFAMSYALSSDGETLAVFSGGLVKSGGHMPNYPHPWRPRRLRRRPETALWHGDPHPETGGRRGLRP